MQKLNRKLLNLIKKESILSRDIFFIKIIAAKKEGAFKSYPVAVVGCQHILVFFGQNYG
jgi:hypothetical protein